VAEGGAALLFRIRTPVQPIWPISAQRSRW
jgi:hypothetical protein